MIVVTRLDRTGGSTYAINPDLIERIAEAPDTILHMVDGTSHAVAEPMAEVIDSIARYRAYVLSLARTLPSDAGTGPRLAHDRSGDSTAAAGTAPVVPLRK